MSGPRLRVAVLAGGRSSEHEISLASAASVVEALDRDRYDVVPVHIRRDGAWELPGGGREQAALVPGARDASIQLLPAETQNGVAGGALEAVGGPPAEAGLGSVDVVLPMLHGPFGEDGTVQGLLETAGVAYVGSGVAGASLTMDKDLVKHVLRGHGIAVARGIAVVDDEPRADLAGRVGEELGYPCFVKPACLGSSVGISKVREPAELAAALERAFEHGPKAIVEELVEGREVEVGVLGNRDPIASLPGEIELVGADWYDYRAKYEPGGMRLHVPADLDDGTAARLQETALLAFRRCECAGLARIDFFVRPDGGVVLNEINTIPGFTSTSVYARLFEASGIPYPELLDRLIELALERRRGSERYRN